MQRIPLDLSGHQRLMQEALAIHSDRSPGAPDPRGVQQPSGRPKPRRLSGAAAPGPWPLGRPGGSAQLVWSAPRALPPLHGGPLLAVSQPKDQLLVDAIALSDDPRDKPDAVAFP
jgi:hypothetical protein